jgi:hypothetical protein
MPVVETLVYLNPLCAGRGDLPVCATHLREYCADALLVAFNQEQQGE